MTRCRHTQLMLLPAAARRLRCRHCHLTIQPDELQMDYCPECYATSGKKHRDFEVMDASGQVRYRCEQCGAIIPYRAGRTSGQAPKG